MSDMLNCISERRQQIRIHEARIEELLLDMEDLRQQDVRENVQGVAIGDRVAVTEEFANPFSVEEWGVTELTVNYIRRDGNNFVAVLHARDGGIARVGVPIDMVIRMREEWLRLYAKQGELS